MITSHTSQYPTRIGLESRRPGIPTVVDGANAAHRGHGQRQNRLANGVGTLESRQRRTIAAAVDHGRW